MSKYKSKKKNSKRSHDQGGFGYLASVSMYEMSKQVARPKETKLKKAVKNILGKLKLGDR